jgi:hypothetical protein
MELKLIDYHCEYCKQIYTAQARLTCQQIVEMFDETTNEDELLAVIEQLREAAKK